MVETELTIIAEFGGPQTGPNGEPNQALLAPQACHKLGSGSAQAKVRFAHLHLRLKQQLLRSKDRNENCSCRDSDIEFPVIAGICGTSPG